LMMFALTMAVPLAFAWVGNDPGLGAYGDAIGLTLACGALLFFSCLCGGGTYWYVSMKAEEGMQALRDYQPPPGTYGTIPTTDPGGSGSVVAPGGDTCAKVDRCCPAFYVARGLPAEQASTTCSQMAAARAMATGPMLETVCQSQMQAFTSAGGGVPVPPECQ